MPPTSRTGGREPDFLTVQGAREHNLDVDLPRDPQAPAGRGHRRVGLGQVVPGLRHPLRRGPAPLRRVAVGLRPPVPRPDGQAQVRAHPRPVARPSPSSRSRPRPTRARPSAPSPRSTTTCGCSTPASASSAATSAAARSSARSAAEIVNELMDAARGTKVTLLAPRSRTARASSASSCATPARPASPGSASTAWSSGSRTSRASRRRRSTASSWWSTAWSSSRAERPRITDSVETAVREGKGKLVAVVEGERDPAGLLAGQRLPRPAASASPSCRRSRSRSTRRWACASRATAWASACRSIPTWSFPTRTSPSRGRGRVLGRRGRQGHRLDLQHRQGAGQDLQDRPRQAVEAAVTRPSSDRSCCTAPAASAGQGQVERPAQLGLVGHALRGRPRRSSSAATARPARSGPAPHYEAYFRAIACKACGGTRLRPESRAVLVGGRAHPRGHRHDRGPGVAPLRRAGAGAARGRRSPSEVLKEIRARLTLPARRRARLPDPRPRRRRRCRAARPSASGWPRSSARSCRACCTCSTSRRSGCTSATTSGSSARCTGCATWATACWWSSTTRPPSRPADHVIDFGPGAGRHGGQVVGAGHARPRSASSKSSLTGRYLSGKRAHRRCPAERREPRGWIELTGAREHNLKDIDVAVPLGRPGRHHRRVGRGQVVAHQRHPAPGAAGRLCTGRPSGWARTRSSWASSRSTRSSTSTRSPSAAPRAPTRPPTPRPSTWCATLFAQTPEARTYGYAPGRFSFNVTAKQGGGRCEACEGAGVREVEMHFLPNVFVTCEVCRGRRYNDATLRVKFKDKTIADVLDTPIDEALELFQQPPPAQADPRRPWSTSAWATWRWARPRPPCRAARPSGSSWPASWPSARPAGPCTCSTSPPPGCTSRTCAACSRCWAGWSTPATPWWSSSTTST